MTYKDIFTDKKPFLIKHDKGVTHFQYQKNDDKGEFIDQNGNVQAQVYEIDQNKEWFVVAGMFMGEIILKTIPYYRTISPKSAHLIRTEKFINNNSN